MKIDHNLNRFIVGALVSAGVAVAGLGLGAGTAQAQPRVPVPADDGGWGPPRHWCPGNPPVQTGNLQVDPVRWDAGICHTYYFVYQGMGNVSNVVWDGDNPPPKPLPPSGLYCDPPFWPPTNCRIGNHP
jgi:hypothetical protein